MRRTPAPPGPAVLVVCLGLGGCPATSGGPPPSPGTAQGDPGQSAAPAPRPVPPPAGTLDRVAAAPVDDCAAPPDLPLEVTRDVVFAPRADDRDRWMDVYRPATAAGPLPALLLFHGGSWAGGDEDGLEGRARWLARWGLAVAAVRYRLASGRHRSRFPAQIADARCAARFLRAQAGRFDVDPGRLLAGGFSAGGHLAALLAVASDVPGLDDDCPHTADRPDVAGAFAWYAPLVLTDDGPRTPALDRIVENFLGGDPTDLPGKARLASVPPHADGADPPMLLVHGAEDDLVPPAHSRRVAGRLGGLGVPVTHLEIPGLGHGFSLLGGRAGERRAACSTAEFLRALVGAGPDGGDAPSPGGTPSP